MPSAVAEGHCGHIIIIMHALRAQGKNNWHKLKRRGMSKSKVAPTKVLEISRYTAFFIRAENFPGNLAVRKFTRKLKMAVIG